MRTSYVGRNSRAWCTILRCTHDILRTPSMALAANHGPRRPIRRTRDEWRLQRTRYPRVRAIATGEFAERWEQRKFPEAHRGRRPRCQGRSTSQTPAVRAGNTAATRDVAPWSIRYASTGMSSTDAGRSAIRVEAPPEMASAPASTGYLSVSMLVSG